MSVPVKKHDGYGLYILESNYAGIPVVQPATGAFPEIIERTGGGITYSPDTIEELSDAIYKLFSDNTLRLLLGETGRKNVPVELSLDKMAAGLSDVYRAAEGK
jgi:glycosyltransferase involved in cell wall biosynthesis